MGLGLPAALQYFTINVVKKYRTIALSQRMRMVTSVHSYFQWNLISKGSL